MSAGNSGQSFHSYEADISVIWPVSPVSSSHGRGLVRPVII